MYQEFTRALLTPLGVRRVQETLINLYSISQTQNFLSELKS